MKGHVCSQDASVSPSALVWPSARAQVARWCLGAAAPPLGHPGKTHMCWVPPDSLWLPPASLLISSVNAGRLSAFALRSGLAPMLRRSFTAGG